jgi:GDPmannose 4,6-dehydratase
VHAIVAGKESKLDLGDLTVEKEWTYAGDVAEGILTLLAQDRAFESVIGSGQGHTIQQWAELCFSIVGLDWRRHVVLVPGFVPEYKRLVSKPDLIFSLGWRPKISFAELAQLMMSS